MKTRLADTISCFKSKRKKKIHKDSILIIALLVITTWRNTGFCDSLSLKQEESGKCVDIRIQDFFFLPKERNPAFFQKPRKPSHDLVDPICAFFGDMLQVYKLQSKDLKKKERKRNVGVNERAPA